MKDIKVGCIGCGVMGSALVRAIAKVVSGKNLVLFDTDSGKLSAFAQELGAETAGSGKEVAEKADYLVLAVKPAYVASVLFDITAVVPEEKLPLFVSVAAGVSLEKLRKAAVTKARFIRLMPNIPAMVGEAMIALTCGDDIAAADVDAVKELLSESGRVEQVPENLMDCVTGISGSGPAYAFVFIEAFADAAVKLGMPRKQAYVYAAQTLKGAAEMVLVTGKHPAALKDDVCSPGGTTIAAVEALEELGFRNAVIKAAVASAERSAELGKK